MPMARLTDTQLIILSAASQRDDRGVELPTNGKGEAARKAVDKLIRAGLLEEVRSSGSLPVWRRDDETGPMALCITKQGLEAIDVGDETVACDYRKPHPYGAGGRQSSGTDADGAHPRSLPLPGLPAEVPSAPAAEPCAPSGCCKAPSRARVGGFRICRRCRTLFVLSRSRV